MAIDNNMQCGTDTVCLYFLFFKLTFRIASFYTLLLQVAVDDADFASIDESMAQEL